MKMPVKLLDEKNIFVTKMRQNRKINDLRLPILFILNVDHIFPT